MPSDELTDKLTRFGAVRVPAALDAKRLSALWSIICAETSAGIVRSGSEEPYGARAVLAASAELADLLVEAGITDLAATALGKPAFPIDATFLDKRSDANWAVPAHQDVIVPIPVGAPADAVRNRRERCGVRYGEPADLVLQELVALRVHFDDASVESGGIAIVEGSHARGRIADAEIRKIPLDSFRQYDCRSGDVLLMKPLVVHRSGRSTRAVRRRVLQVLYAPRDGWHASPPWAGAGC